MGNPLYLCRRCGTQMIRKRRKYKVYGKTIYKNDLYCPQCQKFTKNPKPKMRS